MSAPGHIVAANVPVGAVTQTFDGWDTAALTAFDSGGVRYLRDTSINGTMMFQTQAETRDAEVSFFQLRGTVYVRLGSGRGYYCTINTAAGGTILIGVADGVTSTSEGTTYIRAQATTSGWVSGYSQQPTSDLWTFGAVGHRVYLRFNNTTLLEFYDVYLAHRRGKVAVRANPANAGVARLFVDTRRAHLHDDERIDVRDLGVVATPMNLRGSIESGSAVLTLTTDDHPVVVGQWLIVEPPESRNSDGVGGVWPSTGYADAATILALPTPGDDSCVYDQSNGDVYLGAASGWYRFADDPAYYYWHKKIPKPLVARVAAVANGIITLDTVASKTTSGARVFIDAFGQSPYDSHSLVDAAKYEGLRRIFARPSGAPLVGGVGASSSENLSAIAPTDLRVYFPEGHYASWRGAFFLWFHKGVQLEGDGSEMTIFYRPNWTSEAGVYIKQSEGVTVTGIGGRGGMRLDGYGLGRNLFEKAEDGSTQNPDIPAYSAAPAYTFLVEESDGCRLVDVASEHGWNDVVMRGCRDCTADVTKVLHTDPSQKYLAWHCNIVDSTRCSMLIRKYLSNFRLDGFELFHSEHSTMIVLESVNAVGAFNGSNNCTMSVRYGQYNDGAAQGTFGASDANASFIDVVDHFLLGNAVGNRVIDTTIVILEKTMNTRGIATAHTANTTFENVRVSLVNSDRYGFQATADAANQTHLRGCTFNTKVLVPFGTVTDTAGPRLERGSTVPVSGGRFTVTVTV